MSPRGLKDGVAEGTGTVNKKIYYPSACPREGAYGNRCSQELVVRYGKTDFWGIHKKMEDWRFKAVACHWPQSEG